MDAILVTNHKGGVGKTFVTVHLAKCLSENRKRVLMVDCDGQYDAYRFFSGTKTVDEQVKGFKEVNEHLFLLPNKGLPGKPPQSLKSFNIDEGSYDYILLDSDASLALAVTNILQNKIKLVIAPVNFQGLSIANLEDLIKTMGKLGGIDTHFVDDEDKGEELVKIRNIARTIASQLFVVPLAADDAALAELLKKFRVKTKVRTFRNMPKMKEADLALTKGIPMWQLDELSTKKRSMVKAYFDDLAGEIQAIFRKEFENEEQPNC